MRKKVVFLSIPMTERRESEIMMDTLDAKNDYLKQTGSNIENVAFVNNYTLARNGLEYEREIAEKRGMIFIEPDHMPIWNLGMAMMNLSYCDEAFFYKGWEDSKGCKFEHGVCFNYDIPIVEWRKTENE